MEMQFEKATRERARLRMALHGPAGSGKSYSALSIGKHIAELCGSRVALIDSEPGSSAKYAPGRSGRGFDFDVLTLRENQSPQMFRQAIEAAEKAGYKVIIIDSLSAAWAGKMGALEQVDRAAAASNSKSSFEAWRKVTPEHAKLVDAIMGSESHIIATMQVKTEYVVETNSKGKQAPRKVGLAPVMRDGIEYYFDIVGEINDDHWMKITKSRAFELADETVEKPGPDFAQRVWDWLVDGAPAAPKQTDPKAAFVAAHATRGDAPEIPELDDGYTPPPLPQTRALTEQEVRDVLKTWMSEKKANPQEVADRFLAPHGSRTVAGCPQAWAQIVAQVERELAENKEGQA